MDIFDPKKRSIIMAKIKGKNSNAELIVFRYLRKNAVYFQKHYKRAVGTPDIALPRKKRIVFVDGDFWHGRNFGKLLNKRPGANDYWVNKIEKNISRDKDQMNILNNQGWTVLRVWESDILRKSTRDKYLRLIKKFLTDDG